MKTTKWFAVGFFIFLSFGSPASFAADEAPEVVHVEIDDANLDPNPRKKTRTHKKERWELAFERSRGVTWGTVSAFDVAALALPIGGMLTIYDYNGPWEKKYKYDQVYLERYDVGFWMMPVAGITMGSIIPFLTVSTIAEAYAIKNVAYVPVTMGWLSAAMFSSAGGFLALAAVGGPGWLVPASVLWAHSFGFAIAQFIANSSVIGRHRSGKPVRTHRKDRVRFGLSPTVMGATPGLAALIEF